MGMFCNIVMENLQMGGYNAPMNELAPGTRVSSSLLTTKVRRRFREPATVTWRNGKNMEFMTYLHERLLQDLRLGPHH